MVSEIKAIIPFKIMGSKIIISCEWRHGVYGVHFDEIMSNKFIEWAKYCL